MLKQSGINILRGKKDTTSFSQQACFVNRFTLQGFKPGQENVVASLFPLKIFVFKYIYIYILICLILCLQTGNHLSLYLVSGLDCYAAVKCIIHWHRTTIKPHWSTRKNPITYHLCRFVESVIVSGQKGPWANAFVNDHRP